MTLPAVVTIRYSRLPRRKSTSTPSTKSTDVTFVNTTVADWLIASTRLIVGQSVNNTVGGASARCSVN